MRNLDFIGAVVWEFTYSCDGGLSEPKRFRTLVFPKAGLDDLDRLLVSGGDFDGVCVILSLHDIEDHVDAFEFTAIVVHVRYVRLGFVVQMELHSSFREVLFGHDVQHHEILRHHAVDDLKGRSVC